MHAGIADELSRLGVPHTLTLAHESRHVPPDTTCVIPTATAFTADVVRLVQDRATTARDRCPSEAARVVSARPSSTVDPFWCTWVDDKVRACPR